VNRLGDASGIGIQSEYLEHGNIFWVRGSGKTTLVDLHIEIERFTPQTPVHVLIDLAGATIETSPEELDVFATFVQELLHRLQSANARMAILKGAILEDARFYPTRATFDRLTNLTEQHPNLKVLDTFDDALGWLTEEPFKK